MLSPRGAERAADLERRFASVRVAADNQAVVNSSDVVIISVLPHQADEVLSLLRFSAEHVVVSVMAGVSLNRLRTLVAPATDIARSVPPTAVANQSGLTPIHPATGAALDLYGRLGGVMPVAEETAYESLIAAGATVAAHFAYLSTVADWVVRQGVTEDAAKRYIAAQFAALAPELGAPNVDFVALAAAHSSPGGLNEQFARHLEAAGLLDGVRSGLDDLLRRITSV